MLCIFLLLLELEIFHISFYSMYMKIEIELYSVYESYLTLELCTDISERIKSIQFKFQVVLSFFIFRTDYFSANKTKIVLSFV